MFPNDADGGAQFPWSLRSTTVWHVTIRRGALLVWAVLLLVGTVLVFRAFDVHSHSASDTLRPFVITMAPVWAVSIAAGRVLLRGDR